MALTEEVLKSNEVLAGLSEDQLKAIETLSKNDEAVVIGNRIGELHGGYDNDVKTITGVEKQQGEKSYDFVKRVLTTYKQSAEEATQLQEQIGTLQGKVVEYEKQIEEGKGNEVIVQKLKDTEAKLGQLQSKYETDKDEWDKEKDGFKSKLNSVKVNHAFDTVNLKFKSEYPESVQATLLNAAKSKILSNLKPDWIDNGEGSQVIVFRDEKGTIQNNPENQLKPFTPEELMKAQLKDVIDTGRKQAGGGSNPQEGDDVPDVVDISMAKSQVEADSIIVKHLLKKGLTRGSQEFGREQKEIREKHKVKELPLR